MTGLDELETRRRAHRLDRRVRLALALTLGVLVAWLGLFSPYFVVKQVSVQGARYTRPADVIAAAGVTLGTPLLRVFGGSVEENLKSLREVKSVEVRRVVPDRVIIVLRERQPVAALQTANGWRLVDADGVMFANLRVQPKSLMVIGGENAIGRATAADVAVRLPDWLLRKIKVVIGHSRDDVRFELKGNRYVLFGDNQRIARKLQVLKVLLGVKAREYDVSAPNLPATRS